MTGTGGGLSQLKPADIKTWAEALHKQRDENLGNDSPGTECLPFGFLLGGGFLKVVQTPSLIILLSEDLEYRQIFLDGLCVVEKPSLSEINSLRLHLSKQARSLAPVVKGMVRVRFNPCPGRSAPSLSA